MIYFYWCLDLFPMGASLDPQFHSNFNFWMPFFMHRTIIGLFETHLELYWESSLISFLSGSLGGRNFSRWSWSNSFYHVNWNGTFGVLCWHWWFRCSNSREQTIWGHWIQASQGSHTLWGTGKDLLAKVLSFNHFHLALKAWKSMFCCIQR